MKHVPRGFEVWSLAQAATLVVALLAGCRQVTVPAPVRLEGRGKAEFVTPPAAPDAGEAKMSDKELMTKDDYLPPRAIGTLTEAVYPPAALAAHEGPVSIGIRLVVDVEGRVSDVSSSMLAVSTPTAFAGEFRAAIEAAVAQWRFKPAEVRHFTTVTNAAGTYRSLIGSEKTEWALHVSFSFNAAGVVPVVTKASAAKE